MAMGRPLKFKSVKKLQVLIDEYFTKCDQDETPYLITGLALHLDTTRKTLLEYQERPDFVNAILKAKTRVEASYESSLRTNGRAGDIFGLKNFGWADKRQIEVNDVTDLSVEQLEAKLKQLMEE